MIFDSVVSFLGMSISQPCCFTVLIDKITALPQLVDKYVTSNRCLIIHKKIRKLFLKSLGWKAVALNRCGWFGK